VKRVRHGAHQPVDVENAPLDLVKADGVRGLIDQ
jgi:hypothetical protein